MSSAVGVQIRDSAGALVMDLTLANGWDKLVFDGQGVSWERAEVTSPWVDGTFDASIRKGSQPLTVSLRAMGSTLAQADSRVGDLLDAVSASAWQITRTLAGVSTTWRCRAADAAVSFTTEDWLLNRRTVVLTIPAQPNPTITGA